MTQELFYGWLTCHFVHHITPARPVCLLLDTWALVSYRLETIEKVLQSILIVLFATTYISFDMHVLSQECKMFQWYFCSAYNDVINISAIVNDFEHSEI